MPSAEEAEKVISQLRGGADFSVLAREKSIDATAEDGGLLGRVDPASLRPELRDALRGLGPGQVSQVVRIPTGYAVVKVLGPSEIPGGAAMGSGQQAVTAPVGNIQAILDVDGLGEAFARLGIIAKPIGWEQSPQAICQVHEQSYLDAVNYVNNLLDPESPRSFERTGRSSMDIAQAHYARAQLLAFKGDMDKAIEEWETTSRIAGPDVPSMHLLMEETLGVAYLHKAEMDNDVFRNPGDRCLFPMRDMHYARPAASHAAIAHLLKFLEMRPDDLETKWLLNIAEMTAGGYPDGVPERFRIPPETFASQEPAPRFVDVAPEAGLNVVSMATGVVVGDFDDDGLLDVVSSNYYYCGPMHCFHNNGDGTFTDRAAHAGLANQLGGLNLVAADYNNDGCLDILVLRGAWENLGQRKSLLRNNCDGTFTDVTNQSGLALRATNSQSAAWADIDNDGFLDLFVVNEQGPSELFRNRGDGTFVDISHSSGIDRSAFSKGVTAADYDGDGYVDFFVSNMSGEGFLYHNNHDGTFTDLAVPAGISTERSFATFFFDYDNDGWPDLFVASYFPSIAETARTYLNLPPRVPTLKLFRNLGDGTFDEVTKQTALDKVFLPMGADFGDIDNDGYLDMYLGTGSPSYAALMPNVLLHNHEGKFFTDVTTASGTGELHKGHGVAFADLGNTGNQDILEAIGGAVPGDAHAWRLFENPGGSGNDWVSLQLVGTKANRSAIGAKIKVTVRNEQKRVRHIYRTVGSVSSFGGSPLRQHIGLGKSAEFLAIDITWPGDTAVQNFSHAGKNQFFEIRQGSPVLKKINLPSFRLGGKNRTAEQRASGGN